MDIDLCAVVTLAHVTTCMSLAGCVFLQQISVIIPVAWQLPVLRIDQSGHLQ